MSEVEVLTQSPKLMLAIYVSVNHRYDEILHFFSLNSQSCLVAALWLRSG